MLKKTVFLAFMGLFLLMGVGCCPITKLNISIDVDDSFRAAYGNRPVLVDVVGVSPVEHKRWESYSMTKYWESGDTLRATSTAATVELTLDPSKKEPQVIWANDPHWSIWLNGANDKDAPRIYVLVQLPGTYKASDDKPGNEDPRRQILPTGSCRWDNSAGHPPTVSLVLKADRIVTVTQPKLDKGSP
jgi:hypothetical protein